MTAPRHLPRVSLEVLISALRERGYIVIGPVARDGAVVYDEIASASELPTGLRDRQAGERIRSSEERQRLMLESVVDYAIYMLDPGGRITMWNPGCEHILGYSSGESLGQNPVVHYAKLDSGSRRNDGRTISHS